MTKNVEGEGKMKTWLRTDVSSGHSQPRRDFLKLAAYLGVTLVTPNINATPAPKLKPRELALIGEIAELIIPATDTGGAKATEVPAFIGMMVTQWFSLDEKTHFLEGMRTFDATVLTRYGRSFVDLNDAEKNEWFGEQLKEAEHGSTASAMPNFSRGAGTSMEPRTPFVLLMKRLTVVGYYTSELGATQELSTMIALHNPPGCAPVESGDRGDSFMPYNIPFRAY